MAKLTAVMYKATLAAIRPLLGDLIGSPLGGPRSAKWEKAAKDFIQQHPFCANCGGTDDLQVHHIRPFHLHPDLELDPSNWIVLCEHPTRLCHFGRGHFWNWKLFNPEVVEDCELNLKCKQLAEQRQNGGKS